MFLRINNPLKHCAIKLAGEAGGEKDQFTFTGYASVFNGDDYYNDTILPGAYKDAIADGARLPHMFINHRSWEISVGDWVELSEDKRGLLVKGDIDPIHKDGPTAFSAVKRKALDGLSVSIGMNKDDFDWKDEDDPSKGKIIKRVDELAEISLVNRPADDAARVSDVKSVVDMFTTMKECEDFLRDAGGFSKNAAQQFISQLRGLVDLGDPEKMKAENTKQLVGLFEKYRVGPDLLK